MKEKNKGWYVTKVTVEVTVIHQFDDDTPEDLIVHNLSFPAIKEMRIVKRESLARE